jgi:hypothetical protein
LKFLFLNSEKEIRKGSPEIRGSPGPIASNRKKMKAVVKKVFMGVAIYFEDKREFIPVVLSTTGIGI